jgi:imidazolonepropionase-like amidohydrolase
MNIPRSNFRPRLNLTTVLFQTVGVAFLFCFSGSLSHAENLAITHVTVIDATGSASQNDMTVLISANRIAHIAPSSRTAIPEGSKVVDGTGKFLIPGLWDMHVHWFAIPSVDTKNYLPLFTANGITGVRQMSGEPTLFAWRKEIEDGTLRGPRMNIGVIVDGPNPSGRFEATTPRIIVHNESEAREAVRKLKREGYDFIKVYTHLSRESYYAIVDECKKLDIPFGGHVPDAVTPWEASDAGQHSIEHLENIPQYCSSLPGTTRQERAQQKSTPSAYDPQKCGALFKQFRKNQTWQVPTLVTEHMQISVADPKAMDNSKIQYMPTTIVSLMWIPAAKDEANDTPADIARMRAMFDNRLKIVGAMQIVGVGILAGTDVPVPFSVPGFSLHEELAYLVEAGLTPLQAIQTATLNPARFMGRERDMGTVEVGKIADLVLLDENPLKDIHNTRKIDAVIQNGKLIAKSELEKILADIAALGGGPSATALTSPEPSSHNW